jgi:catechol 2,3-dioxygenase-like lactoylglutathione lyase family enzyme
MTSPNGTTILGHPIVHVGYNVEDIERAVDFLVTSFGAGPFFLMKDIRIPRLSNDDGPVVWEHSAAFGQWGGVAVELQQLDKLEPADAFGATYQRTSGFNHVAYAVDDLAAEAARLRTLGFPLLFEAINGPHRSNLYDAPLLGHTIEVHQDFDLFHPFHRSVAEAAEGWDGKTDRLRPVSDEIAAAVLRGGEAT